MKTLRHKFMRKSRRVLSLLGILFIVSMGIIPMFISYAISDEENATSKEKTEILWENDTEVGDFDFEEPDEVESYKNYDWGDKTFGDSDSVINVDELRQDNIIEKVNLVEDPQKEVKLAVAAALTGVLGMSAIGGVKAKQKFQDQGGLKVSEKDQSKILAMINKASKKQYIFDEDGYLVFDNESPYNEKGSATYSKLIDAIIESDRDITVGIADSYKTVEGEKRFEGDNQGVSVGDNRTEQVVVVSGLSSPLKDVEGNEIYGGAELTLAHELAHAVRGAYGLRNDDLTDDGVNEDEEAAAIGFENKVRYELGYGLRGDGSARSDVNNDGIADGDGSYGEYTDDSDDWFDNIELNESASLTGSIFNFRRSKKKRKRDKERARRKRDKRERRRRIRKSKSRLDKIKRDIKKKNSSRSSSKKKKKKKSSSRNKRPSTSSSSSKSNKKDPRTDQLDNAVKNWDKKDKNYNSAVKLYEKAKKDLLSAKSNSDRSNALSRLDGLNKYFSKNDDKKAKTSSSTKKEEKKKEEKKKEEKKNTQTNSTTQGNSSNAEPKTDKSEVVEGFTPEYEINPKLINEENPVGGSSERNGKSEIIEQAQVIAEEYIENKIFKEPDWWSEMKFNDFSLRKSISNKLVDAVQREKSLNDIEFVASFYINYRMAMLGNTGSFTGYGKIADYSYTLAQTIVDEQPSFFDVSLINRKSLMNAANDVVKLEESNFKYLLLDKNEKFVEQLNVVNDNIREQKFEIYDNENDNIILKSEIIKYISKVIYINENLVQSKAMWKSLQGR